MTENLPLEFLQECRDCVAHMRPCIVVEQNDPMGYCLVIYYQNVKSYNAGILTALSNQIGDVSLLIVIA